MKGDGAGGTRVRLRPWRRPRRLRLRRPGGPAARRSACVLHAVAMFVQQQVAVVVACVWRVPAVVCVREELLLLERAIAAPVLSRLSARTLRSRFNSQRAGYTAAGIGGATVTHGGAISPYRSTPTSLLLQPVCCRGVACRSGHVSAKFCLFSCHVTNCSPTRAAPASSSTRIASSTRCAQCSSAARAPPTSPPLRMTS